MDIKGWKLQGMATHDYNWLEMAGNGDGDGDNVDNNNENDNDNDNDEESNVMA